jgi:phospho-N-acetylmuramoyl-pentapeptide-transferase
MITSILKVFIPATLAFFIGISITPFFSHFFYQHRLWKRSIRSDTVANPGISEAFNKIHNAETEGSTPRVGGMIIWVSVLLTVFLVYIISLIFPSDSTSRLNFLSRNQTFLPFFSLIAASLIGLLDDLLQIFGSSKFVVDGLSRRNRILLVTAIALVGAWWFFMKLGVASVVVPFIGSVYIGWLFIPFFVLVVLATFSGSVIDGIDGLAAGVLASSYAAFATIAYFQHQIDISVFCAVIAGSILAFLWFNVPPARFYMGETGMLGLTVTLAIIAFLTNTVFLLPIIALPLVVTSLSVIIQKLSRHFRHGKRVFKVAPLHHHFQALGWPSAKVTMRFWIISIIFAIIGVIIALIS